MAWSVALALGAGCSGDGETKPDDDTPTTETGSADTGPTTPISTGETGTTPTEPLAEVTLKLGGNRRTSDVRVFVSAPSGAFLRTETTSSPEIVIDEVPVGAFVTEARDTPDGWRLTTVADVQDGDVITFPDHRPDESVGSYTLLVLSEPSVPYAFWELQANCLKEDNAVFPVIAEVEASEGCLPGTTVDAFAWAYSATLQPLAIAYAAAAPLEGAPPDLSGSVTLGDWNSEYAQVEVRYQHTGDPARLTMAVDARRGGVSAPVGFEKSQTVSDAQEVLLATPIDAAFHDEFQIRLAARPSDVDDRFTEVVLADRSLPSTQKITTVTVGTSDLPPVVDAWSIGADKKTVMVPLPLAWECQSRSANLAEVRLSTASGTPVPSQWTYYGPHASQVTLPDLDPAATDAVPAGGFANVDVRVRSVAGGFDDLRQSPVLTEGPGAWLSAGGQSGRVCTARQAL